MSPVAKNDGQQKTMGSYKWVILTVIRALESPQHWHGRCVLWDFCCKNIFLTQEEFGGICEISCLEVVVSGFLLPSKS